MKIEILCGGGSPNGIIGSDVNGNEDRVGIGGAELALFTLCKAWQDVGHDMVIYNNPRREDGLFQQRPTNHFDKHANRDVLIVWREPNPKITGAKGLKVWFSTDQYTIGDYKHFSVFPDKIVTISPYHSDYFEATYGIRGTIPIDLPVRVWEYEKEVEKVPNRLIFTSVPDRGLEFVARTLPRIREAIPDVSLVVTSDYRLWGVPSPMNSQFMTMFLREPNVQFLGAIGRQRLVEEQLKAQILYYPATYEELFCIACAESMVAGTLPITTGIGALSTTNMGVLIDGNAKNGDTQKAFVDKTIEYLTSPSLSGFQETVRQKALSRFSPDVILAQWESLVFNGG